MAHIEYLSTKKQSPPSIANLRQARFNRLVGPLSQDVFRYLCWLGGDKQFSEDITQEVLIRAWRSLDHLRSDAAVKSWLFTIARRERARAFSRKTLHTISIEDLSEHCHADTTHEQDYDLAELKEAILRLAPKDREPLVMQVLLGLETGEIAEILGITRCAVLTRLHRARKRLIAKTQKLDKTKSQYVRKAS